MFFFALASKKGIDRTRLVALPHKHALEQTADGLKKSHPVTLLHVSAKRMPFILAHAT
jgi:hypothetical protein